MEAVRLIPKYEIDFLAHVKGSANLAGSISILVREIFKSRLFL